MYFDLPLLTHEEVSASAEELAATADQLRALVARFRLDGDELAGGSVTSRRRSSDWERREPSKPRASAS